MKKSISILSFAVILSACAGSGSINWDRVRQLQVGMTESEVVERLGEPYRVTGKSDGTEIWHWVSVNSLTGATKSFSVVMKEGKAVDVPKVPSSY